MIYLASPYSHPDPLTVEDRVHETERFVAHYVRQGYVLFSPIVHCHRLALNNQLPTSAAFWQTYNEAILRQCLAMWVLRLPGWAESKGVMMELQFAHLHGIPVEHKEPLE